MKLPVETNLAEQPIYCRACGSQNTYERDAEHDLKTPQGKVLWERWKCKVCGNSTIRPVGDMVSIGQ